MYNIILYGGDTCMKCMRAKQSLEKHNLKFKYVDVMKDDESTDRFIKESGQEKIPLIKFNGEFIREPSIFKSISIVVSSLQK